VIEQRRMGSDENIGTSQELGYKEIWRVFKEIFVFLSTVKTNGGLEAEVWFDLMFI
jgi:hypothetical protein